MKVFWFCGYLLGGLWIYLYCIMFMKSWSLISVNIYKKKVVSIRILESILMDFNSVLIMVFKFVKLKRNIDFNFSIKIY